MLSRINDTFFRGKKELWKKIIKCALAYEITFILILVPPVMQILSYGVPYLFVLPVIFFNASGTAGYQIEEIILNIVVLVPSAIFCGLIVYFCTLYNKALEAGAPLYSNGVAIIASFSYFVCVFTMAYTRVKYPRLFFASLHGLMLPFFALTRNIYSTSFSVLSIAGIVYPVLMGAVVSLLVNLCLWPETASKGLEISLGKSLTALHQVLNYLRDEMHGEPLTNDVSVSRELQRLNDALQASIDEMRKAQKEAKYEIVVSRYSPLWYKPVVRSIDKLAKHMLGISLAVERVNRIMIESKISSQLAHSGSSSAYRLHTHWLRHRHMDADHKLLDSPPSSIHRAEYKHLSRLQSSLEPTMQRFMRACTICLERVEKDLARGKSIPKLPGDESTSSEQQQQQQGTADASLASEQTIASGPADKQAAAAPDTIEDDHDSGSTADDLASALEQFWLDAETILSREYRDEFASPMEEHYLMYTINYALTAFGKELLVLDQQVQELLGRRPSNSWPRIFFPRVPLHKWLSHDSKNDTGTRLTDEQFVLDQQQELERQATRQSEMHAEASAGYTKEDSSSIISQPIPLHNVPGRHYWNNWLFRLNKWLRYGPTRYAIKFTVVMELLALMAWLPFPGVNDLYVRNHGQWAMLHSVVVSNFTVGATAQQCFFRIISTIIGAVLGYVVLIAGNRNENPYVIAVLILVFQVILWYIYLGTKYPRIGFISLLTMAIITSTGYADTYDERLIDPTWKRTLTAIIAIFVTIVVDQLFWPVWARKTMRKTLANLLLETGIQYSKVASLVCQEDMTSSLYVATARDVEKANKDLRRQLRTTTQMLGLVATEPRLTKGPFPAQTYRNILDLEKKILYWIQHLYEVQKFIPSNVRREITVPVSLYRKDLAAAVHLYLFTLAGSLRTKSSLPAVLPSAEVARQALQHQQGLTWKDSYQQVCAQGDNKSPNMEPLVYWHTYAAGSVEIIILQEAMGQLVVNLMGQHVFLAATEDWINA